MHSILSQMNRVYTLTPVLIHFTIYYYYYYFYYSFTIYYLSSNLRLDLSSDIIPSDFSVKMLYAVLISPISTTCATHLH
jgi:hypothetical protein